MKFEKMRKAGSWKEKEMWENGRTWRIRKNGCRLSLKVMMDAGISHHVPMSSAFVEMSSDLS